MTELEKVIEEQKKIFISLFGSDYNEFWTCPSGKRDLEKLIAIVKKASREEAIETVKKYFVELESKMKEDSITFDGLFQHLESLRNPTNP